MGREHTGDEGESLQTTELNRYRRQGLIVIDDEGLSSIR